MLVAVLVALSSPAVVPVETGDLARMQGEWRLVSVTADGRPLPTLAPVTGGGYRVTIRGSELRVHDTGEVSAVTIDQAARPRHMSAGGEGWDYQIDGDTVTAHYRPAGGDIHDLVVVFKRVTPAR